MTESEVQVLKNEVAHLQAGQNRQEQQLDKLNLSHKELHKKTDHLLTKEDFNIAVANMSGEIEVKSKLAAIEAVAACRRERTEEHRENSQVVHLPQTYSEKPHSTFDWVKFAKTCGYIAAAATGITAAIMAAI